MDLKNKTIIVMGAAGRLGHVVAQRALDRGANVVAVDVEEWQLHGYKPHDEARLTQLVGSITNVDSIRKVISDAEDRFGSISGAVNAAYPRSPSYGRSFFDVTYESFCENVSMHLGGYFLFMQQCADLCKRRGTDFSLVNFSSIYGVMAPRFEVYAGTNMTMPVEYAAIKSAIQHLGRYVSSYMKGTKFRVNCVSPGGIAADQDRAFLEAYNSFCRDKGMLDPDDIAEVVLFLLSDSSRYICGQNIIVDDGFSL